MEKALEEKKNKEKKEEKKSSSWRSYLGGLGAGGGDDEDSVKTLDEVLENYGETETLDVVNSWKCSKCKVDGEAIKEVRSEFLRMKSIRATTNSLSFVGAD